VARQDEPIYAKTIAELGSLSDQDLAEQHDRLVNLGHVSVGVSYYLSELSRRTVEKQNRRMEKLTGFIAVLTVINVIAVIVGLSG
jgi:hypothetical protein